MTDIPDDDTVELLELADKLAAVLREFPANGQLRGVDPDTMLGLTLGGFVERREVERACKCCGKPQLDHSYFRITAGGKLFMAAMRELGDCHSLVTAVAKIDDSNPEDAAVQLRWCIKAARALLSSIGASQQ